LENENFPIFFLFEKLYSAYEAQSSKRQVQIDAGVNISTLIMEGMADGWNGIVLFYGGILLFSALSFFSFFQFFSVFSVFFFSFFFFFFFGWSTLAY
jgi:hypothetical protein